MRNIEFDKFPLAEVGHTVLMAGVIYDGPQHTYLVPFPGCGAFDSGDVVELLLTLDEWNLLLKQADQMETEVLRKATDGTIVKALIRKCERNIAAQVSWNVFKRDRFSCRYCGLDDKPLTVDHLILWEEGGPSVEANLIAACKKCNKVRGRMPYEEWLNSGYYRGLERTRQAWQDEANMAVLANLDTVPRLTRVRTR